MVGSRNARSALLAAAAVILATDPASAQSVPCGDGPSLVAHLETQWGEAPAVIALDAHGRLVRIYANPETGTWSVLLTRPGGPTCLVQHGTGWEALPSPTLHRDSGDPT